MDKALKQRLVGASVLVALAVVVLPMLLSGQQGGPQESRRIDLPPKPQELAFETRRFPIGEPAEGQPSQLPDGPVLDRRPANPVNPDPGPDEPIDEAPVPGAEPAPEPARPDDSASTPEPGEELAVDAAPVEPPAAEPAPAMEAPGGERYLVQVASFSSTANADRLAQQLGARDLPVLRDTVDAAAGRLYRVRVGPYDERSAADAAIAVLNRDLPDLNPRVLDLRPDEAAQVTEATDPMVRWVVQVGSFSAQENADSLVYRLRDAGYRASSETVRGDGSPAYKVRVGPVLERQEAVQLAAAINRDLGLEGLIMSAD